MALPYTRDLHPIAIVYDCIDELSAFAGAPPSLKSTRPSCSEGPMRVRREENVYNSKRALHPHVHLFPSSVDVSHFARARQRVPEPGNQAGIPHPRLGFFGVIDERMDYALVSDVARMRPDWHIVLFGRTAKVDAAELPRAANIHYLGITPYAALPDYIAGWDVALLPFALNDATRFISPTKTPNTWRRKAGGLDVDS